MTAGRVPLDFVALAPPVARALLGEPNPRMSTARELRYGRKGSLAVRLDTGQWFDHESGGGGGVLDLVIHEGEASDRAGAARWLESQGFTDPARARESRCEAPRASRGDGGAVRCTAHGPSSKASMQDAARQLWNETRPLAGTPADHYLRARGVGHVTGAPALRFHPSITHRDVPGRFPALVAGVQDADERFVGIHRTYLDGASKAALDSVRLSLGPIGGGAVRILEPVDDALLVGEGIETTAAAVKVLGWRGGAWAALSTSGMTRVVLPELVVRVVVAADRDPGGLRAAAALADRLESEGRRVTIEAPAFGDFADWQGEAA